MKKFICVHGHFYQPPRENPWTGEVEKEESAKPYHDWNERVAKECYEANARAPILDGKGKPAHYVNNFSQISFDIGPTLLSWLKRKNPETYRAIIDADRQSVLRRSGHGNAMAQVYNHVIMPLASRRDKITQVVWGIRDFEFHYRRKPEGMWLSETAVDRETLNILAEQGILFTVLAPHQAKKVRHIGFGSRWHYTHHESVDPKRVYRIFLDRGKQFHLFFYDGPVSRAVAFQGLLQNGDNFVNRLMGAFGHRDGRELLVSTATDGETFGHHHLFGEMAVAYALKKVQDQKLADITNYAEFLSRYGSYWEADIHEESSWSCSHGIERWRSDCGCRIDFHHKTHQKWRGPLREAFHHLQGIVDRVFETETGDFLNDPWQARDDYIDVMLDGSEESKKRLLAKNARRDISGDEAAKLWSLLEAEKFSLFMFTSCGWFFDDISGIEPVQCMKFAARAMELVQPYRREPIEPAFLKILAAARSNIPEMGTGADTFNRFAKDKHEIRSTKHETNSKLK
ncbi:MAG: DUF3536 domain-containing protein [Candidatus Omnitrophica bacterium]|nr:DUF3536 domain-containing protein [Candidatus Omnitrophota bacterium]